MLCSAEDFLTAMGDLFKTCRESGSVSMTVKPYDGQDRPEPRDGTPGKWKKQKLVLIRVSFSTFLDHGQKQLKSDSGNKIFVKNTFSRVLEFGLQGLIGEL